MNSNSTKYRPDLYRCPVCAEDWYGGDYAELLFNTGQYKSISEAASMSGKMYKTRFYQKNVLDIEYQGQYDGVTEYECKTCGSRWNRFSGILVHKGSKQESGL